MKHLLFTILALLSFSYSFADNKWEDDYAKKNTTPTSGSWTYNYTKNFDQASANQRRVNCILAGTTPGFNGTTKTVRLTGDIMIRYSVFVGLDGVDGPTTLIIENGTDRQITIWNDLDNNDSPDKFHGDNFGTLFSVWENCKLIIRGGGKGKEIIIGGNYNHRPNSAIINYGFLESTGNLELEHVIIEHVRFNETNARSGECSVMKIHPWYNIGTGWTYEQGYTKLSNCEIRHITMPGGVGAAMYCYLITQNKDNNTRERCTIELNDVYIHDVHQGGQSNDGNGGIIRFRGDWVGDLKLNRLHIENCESEASCAGVYWNALGRSSDPCKMYVNNCTFDKCTVTGSNQNGGAMMVEGRCEFIGNTTTFKNCSTTGAGGGLYIHNYNSTDSPQAGEAFSYNLGTNLLFQNNSAAHGGGVAIKIDDAGNLPNGTNFYIDINGAKFEINKSTAEGGALKIDYGGTKYPLTLNLNSGTFTGNSSNNGGAIYSYRANVSYSSGLGADAVCEFSGNTANASGSAMYINQAPYFNMKTVKAYNSNTCTYNDGVIYLESSKMTMENGIIDGNTSAGWGGGLHMKNSTLTINKGQITNNTCNNRGGGIYMNNSTLTINNGIINNNTSKAEFGGGVCAIDNSNFTMHNGQINGNSSPNEGGGVYVKGSSFTMTNGEINGNKASSHGGGIYFDNDVTDASAKTFKFGGGSISNNTSGGFGGGVCIYTGGTLGSTFEITGGNISNNTAANGGGLYLNAWGVYINDARIPLTNTKIENNTAYMGGGVLVYNGGINYKNGLIRYNKAIARAGNSEPGTMYQQNHCDNTNGDKVDTSKSGIGGGIYSTWSQINFETSDKFGIYSNTADFGADDLFANAHNSTMDLPNPIGMTVTGFNVPSTSLHWYEDYIKGDTGFSHKPSTAGSGPASGAERYRTLLYDLSNDLAKSKFEPLDDSGDYIMAALGYNLVYAKIAKTGLKAGETAIMNIYEGDISSMSGAKPYTQVALTGGSDGNAQRQILLRPGEWTVVESKWSWSYTGEAEGTGAKTVDSLPAITRSIEADDDENTRTFSFSNRKTDTEHNAEECVKNKINL